MLPPGSYSTRDTVFRHISIDYAVPRAAATGRRAVRGRGYLHVSGPATPPPASLMISAQAEDATSCEQVLNYNSKAGTRS